ncbi:MAG: hypothetical protein E7614_09120 [Ruminococcaceae bacterium]|nr:hypothetical protein [Oscillospiraceae bacterium]
MKKRTILLSLCLCLAILLSSCSNQTPPNDNDGSKPSEGNEVQYSLYLSDSYGSAILNLNLPSEQIQTKPADEKNFFVSSKTKIEDPDNIGSTRTLKIAGQSYDLDYTRTYRTKLYESDQLKSHAEIIDFRKNKIRAEYRASDGELLFFGDLNMEGRNISGDLTEDEAKELAVSTLTEVYGKDIFNEYVFDYVLFTDNQSTKRYSVVYTKYVHGIPTNDMIQMGFNLNGNLISINALMLGVYDNAEKDITKEQIDNALAYLNSTLEEVSLPTLIVDSLGDYYLRAYSSTTVNGAYMPFIVYINIE